LFTAIPLVFSHVLFKEWIGKFENKMKAASGKLVTLVTNYKKDPSLLDPPKPPKPAKGDRRDDEDDYADEEDEPRRAAAGRRESRRG
ncbi:MAG: hypothetical protein K2X82_08680, partial [Gemmataceae bacterium]|nr:hypothetical protein [Gemmataceae bacterium]